MNNEKKKPRALPPPMLTIELSKSVTTKGSDGETVYDEINLEEPNLDQITEFVKRAGSKGALESMRWLISEISGVPMVVLGKIKSRDYYKAQDYLSAYLTPPDEDDPEGNAGGSQ
ncbi:phage tail assembly protein [Paraburkholderia bryophila]|uniref:Tail assembly chaperone E/41/14-like protein n=1 Tax=Paraburkholderia bryophila TaxID=420952 RepID=A0A7Y9WIA9_9BURK|nr:phage tail assembly protein [Paraburkholderia bryophila]NYH21384.1 hypothetical protein [Paraburkholderia bryophila]